jgi:opacity protein-like surface antigen
MTLRSLALAATALVGLAGAAQAATLVGLTADNRLVSIDTETRRAAAPVAVRGVEGRLLGIDIRPADGSLWALSDAGILYVVDPRTGQATMKSRLSERFESGGRAVVDFNPTVDRLRVMGVSGANLRINVDTGATIVDGTLNYHAEDRNAGTTPRITAGAYLNSVRGATTTALLTIDTLLGQLNLQAPPNDGAQRTRGPTGVALPPGTAFDILADGDGRNTGFLVAAGALHTINLDTGAVTTIGPIANLPGEVIDIAAMR